MPLLHRVLASYVGAFYFNTSIFIVKQMDGFDKLLEIETTERVVVRIPLI